jgi:N-formylglutamate deformylase
MELSSSLILHIPHASRMIPPEVRANLLPDDITLARELLCMTDAWTDELVEGFRLPAIRVMAPVSRLVVDVERFADDAAEPMAAQGMGAVYERLSSGEPLRLPDPVQRELLLERWYHSHHARLSDAVNGALAVHGRCLIIDVHSFASAPLPHEPDQDPHRSQICLGTDSYHSPWDDGEAALAACRIERFSAALNRPFAGALCLRGIGENT